MRRKIIAFDLDVTLAPSKSPLPDRMAEALDKLLNHYHVCVISGGKFGQFQKQLLNNLRLAPEKLARLHLMPTCGTRYYRYDPTKKAWQEVYAENLAPAEKQKIIKVLQRVVKELGYDKEQIWGDTIEDRESQITWSALGQTIVEQLGEEGVRRKEAWDPDAKKKRAVRDAAAVLLPEFEVRVGGASSVDVTKPGIDKAYGMQRLMEMLNVSKEGVFFIGDRLQEGGNDYPVKLIGINTLEVRHWQDTALAVEAIAAVS